MHDIEKKIKEYILNTAAITPGKDLTNNTLLFEEGLFDSMGFMALINFIQEDLHIQPNDDDLIVDNFESIDAIVRFVSKKQPA